MASKEEAKENVRKLVENFSKFSEEELNKKSEEQIKNIDYEIDKEVYKLYGITEEEKKIIEESLR